MRAPLDRLRARLRGKPYYPALARGARVLRSLQRLITYPARVRRCDAVPGHLHFDEGAQLYELARGLPSGAIVVEIGSYKGRSANFLAAGAIDRGVKIHCVDTWNNDFMHDTERDVFDVFRSHTRTIAEMIEIHRGRSDEAARVFRERADLLFLDGDHSYEGARDDLSSWIRHVRPGGWVVCHDYGNDGSVISVKEAGGTRELYVEFGVRRAVEEAIAAGRITTVRMVRSMWIGRKLAEQE